MRRFYTYGRAPAPRPNLDPFAGVLDDVGIASPRKGNDVIESGDAADDLWGRGGADDLDGGAGRDFIFGGTGQDRCVNGEDVFTCEVLTAALRSGQIDAAASMPRSSW